jgi:hypothetical protein
MKTGILVDNLSASQKAFAILSNPNNCYVFCRDIGPVCFDTAKMVSCWYDAYSFDGRIISTSLESTRFAVNLPVSKVYYYVWDLEWLRPFKNDYITNLNIIHNDRVELIARSESHKKAIELYSNKKVSQIIENFSYEQLR